MPQLPNVDDPRLLTFLESGVAILLSTATVANEPRLARAWGCVAGNPLVVLVPTNQGAALLRALADGGSLAIVFSRVSDFRTLQIHARSAKLRAPSPLERAAQHSYQARFTSALIATGMPPQAVTNLFTPEDTTAVVVQPEAWFDQTPGPGAGEPVEARWQP